MPKITITIEGPTGCGKTRLSKKIHDFIKEDSEEERQATLKVPSIYSKEEQKQIINAVRQLVEESHSNARDKGFHKADRGAAKVSEMIALIHSEVSEMLEARRDFQESEKIPGFDEMEEEAADVVIRVMDLAGLLGLRLGEAIIAKQKYNRRRQHKHGKKF